MAAYSKIYNEHKCNILRCFCVWAYIDQRIRISARLTGFHRSSGYVKKNLASLQQLCTAVVAAIDVATATHSAVPQSDVIWVLSGKLF